MGYTLSATDLMGSVNENSSPVFQGIKYSPIERSFFNESLRFVTEMKTEYRGACAGLYMAIKEADGDSFAIHESFGDFVDTIKGIIDKFLKFIKNLFQRFVTMLNKLISSSSYLKNHKKTFAQFGTDHEFHMKLFNYTHLMDSNIPLANADVTFGDAYSDLTKRITDAGSGKRNADDYYEAIKTAYDEFMDHLDNKFYDEFRSKVIGKTSDTCDAESYSDYLFEFFRDEERIKLDTLVTASLVGAAYSRFEHYDNSLSAVKKVRTRVEKDYESVKKKVEKMRDSSNKTSITLKGENNSTYNTAFVNDQIRSIMDLFIRAKADQIQQMCSIHSLAFGAKLDAMAEQYRQDKVLLYTALQKLQKKKVILTKEDVTNASSDEDGNINVKIKVNVNGKGADVDGEKEDCVSDPTCTPDNDCDYTKDDDFDIDMDDGWEDKSDIKGEEDEDPDLYEEQGSDFQRYVANAAFLLQESIAQQEMQDFVNEHILDDTEYSVDYLTEGVMGKIKEKLNKIMQFLKNIWGRFMESMNKLFKDDAAYLEKYKDYILKREPLEVDFKNHYVYNVRLIADSTIPELNYEAMKASLTDDETFAKSRAEFTNILNSEGARNAGADATLAERFKYGFRGKFYDAVSSRDKNAVNWTTMFDYCAEWKNKVNPKLEKMQQSLNRANSYAFQLLEKNKPAEAPEQTTTTSSTPKPNTPPQVNSRQVDHNSASTYDEVMNMYFNETDIGKSGDSSSSTNAPTGAVNNSKQNSVAGRIKDNPNTTQTMDNNIATGKSAKEYDEMGEKLEVYFRVCQVFVAARLSIAEEAYREWMKLIRWHVQNQINKSGDNKVQQRNDQANKSTKNQQEQKSDDDNQKPETVDSKKGIFSWFGKKKK